MCQKAAPDARLMDNVLVGILKEVPLTNAVVGDILEALNIRPSLINSKPTFGDVCGECAKAMVKESEQIIKDGVKSISDKLLTMANKTRPAISEEAENHRWFQEMTRDAVWGRRR